MTPLLEVDAVSKRFGGLVAVNRVSFTLQEGAIAGILGPNGAGKTSLFNLLTGFIAPDSGAVRFQGRDLGGMRPHRIVNLGLARTFQLTRPFVGMTVLENVLVACMCRRVRDEPGRREERARALLDAVGLSGKADGLADALPYGDLRRLEIARALATRPRLLLLDEPFAGLGHHEIAPLSDLIRRLHRDEGLSILMIEHKLSEFMQLVTRVIAINFGEVIADGPPVSIVHDPKVVDAYIGTAEADVAAS